MGLRDWLKRRRTGAEDPRLRSWRERWIRVAASVDATEIEPLRSKLDALGLPEEDIEIEREMLEALQERAALSSAIRVSGLPTIETGHRVVRAEACHFTAPVSMPEEPGQPAGRLLLTSGRAIFVGGATGMAAAWHTISGSLNVDRDVVLIRNGREQPYRFRCNTYGDALRGAFIAAEILASRRRASSSL
jgi:hypothetical protein